jgi:hypothetical protein
VKSFLKQSFHNFSVFEGVVDTQEDEDTTQNLLEEDRFSHHEKIEKDNPDRNEIEVTH